MYYIIYTSHVYIYYDSTKTLERLAEELRGQYDVQVVVITADAAKGRNAIADIMTQVKRNEDINLTLLVNNVGVEFGDPCPLLLKKVEDIDGMIDINVRFSTLFTAACLPLLLNNATGKSALYRAGIINVASTAANATPPLLAVYSGTKAYNRAFSTSLSSELRQRYSSAEVDVLSARASFVETRMSGLKAGCLQGYLMQVLVNFVIVLVNVLHFHRFYCMFFQKVILPSTFASSCLDKLSFVDDISPVSNEYIGEMISYLVVCHYLMRFFNIAALGS